MHVCKQITLWLKHCTQVFLSFFSLSEMSGEETKDVLIIRNYVLQNHFEALLIEIYYY